MIAANTAVQSDDFTDSGKPSMSTSALLALGQFSFC